MKLLILKNHNKLKSFMNICKTSCDTQRNEISDETRRIL